MNQLPQLSLARIEFIEDFTYDQLHHLRSERVLRYLVSDRARPCAGPYVKYRAAIVIEQRSGWTNYRAGSRLISGRFFSVLRLASFRRRQRRHLCSHHSVDFWRRGFLIR